MTKAKAGPISADRLKSFIERIEKLEEERAAIGGDIRDVYSEAKGVGYDVKTMRRIIQLRKKDAAERDEEEQLLDVYAHALGMVAGNADVSALGSSRGPTEEELMERAGKILREVDLCATHLVLMNGAPPKIEAIKALIGCSTGKAAKLRTLVIERIEGFSSRIADDDENENRETAAVKQPGESSRHDRRADGPGSALANLSDREEAPPRGSAGEPSEPSGSAEQSVYPAPPLGSASPDIDSGEGKQSGIHSEPGWAEPSPDVPVNGGESRCGPGRRPTEASRIERPTGAPDCIPRSPPQPDECSTGEEPMQHEVARVVPPVPDLRYDPYEESPPPFLDRRHKARATG